MRGPSRIFFSMFSNIWSFGLACSFLRCWAHIFVFSHSARWAHKKIPTHPGRSSEIRIFLRQGVVLLFFFFSYSKLISSSFMHISGWYKKADALGLWNIAFHLTRAYRTNKYRSILKKEDFHHPERVRKGPGRVFLSVARHFTDAKITWRRRREK